MARFPDGVVVAGASAAGLAAADGLREGGWAGSILVLDAETDPGYDRPMLSKALVAGDGDTGPTALRTPEQLAAQQIQLLAGHAAMGLDIDRRFVVTNWGEAIPFQHLVIATGVTARPLLAADGEPLPTLRTRADLTALRAATAGRGPVMLLGGGFIGLEVASSLRARGLDVDVVDAAPAPLAGALGPAVARWLLDLHRANGVRLHLGVPVTTVDRGSGYTVRLADGRTLAATAVLAGIGTEPATRWLTGSGVTLDGGVVVDAVGRTNVPGVWAAGDVAAAPAGPQEPGGRRRFEHWTHAVEHGRHVGLAIARGDTAPFDAVPYVWTEHHGRTLHLLGERRPGDADVVLDGDLDAGLGSSEFVVGHVGPDGALHGVAVCGRVGALRTFKKLLRSGATVDDARAATVRA